jgi:carboxyl-terminal processing protease
MDGEYNGIGIAVLTNSDGDLQITTVYSSSPASEAGIEPGDILVSINGSSVKEKTLQEVVDMISNATGNVALVVRRGGDEYTFNVEKTDVEMDMVETEDVDEDGIGYIHITHFNGEVKQQFIDAVNAAKSAGAKGIIVDVRNNPGGSLSAVTQILDYLLPEGLIVYTVDKNGNREEWDSDENSEDIPMICLTNGHSASASEIFAGTLKDYGRATIVGKTTFGKGIVQTVFSIPSTKEGLKVTTATYYTKSGQLIQGNGITPNVEVENTGDEDTQLNTAHQLLLEQISN